MTTIPPLDLTQQYATIEAEVGTAVLDVLASGRYINGPQVEEFVQAFKAYVGSPECVACNSGTDALYLALRALEIGPGDEVITSPFTFIATAETISAVGATPVFVDIDPNTFNLDLDQIETAITERTKALMPVHLFGCPVDMTRLMAVAVAHRLPVIEDCAQATGATWQGQRVGSMGDFGCFSFFPSKNLGGCGDGGALTVRLPELAEAARIVREHGSRVKYYHESVGINSRLDTVQAAILQIKLRYLDRWNQGRTTVAERYHQLLAPIDEVICPSAPAGSTHVWNQYTLRLHQATGEERDRVRAALQAQGILTMVYYPLPLHHQPVYAELGYGPGSFPQAEQASQQVLSLPMFPELTPEQQERVVYGLKAAILAG
ncbi:MAG: DegT/DnrJ/EryC1/StrS family aminotransferase [Leptolyngbya sp. SIO4C1]|nr:DegT/DnrJ/EryC1/StrS family aminotransferase [Leptolyngbya sp. SIO4C1]